MRPTRRLDLVIVVVVAGVTSYLVTSHAYAELPRPSAFAPLALALLAIAEVYLALVTRARIARRPGTKALDPLAVARFAALAKATAIVAALGLGGYAGYLGDVATRLSAAAGADTRAASIGLAVTVVLLAAALLLENACRTPDDDDGPGGRR